MFPEYQPVQLSPSNDAPEYAHLAGRTFLFFGLVGVDEQQALIMDKDRQFFVELVPLSVLVGV